MTAAPLHPRAQRTYRALVDAGLELLAEEQDPAMQRQTLALVNQSVAAIAAKLSFFRLAFGGRDGMDSLVETALLDRAIRGLLASRPRVKLAWVTRTSELPAPVARLLLLLAMLAGESLARGGDLTLAADARAGRMEIVVRAVGDRPTFSNELRALLMGEALPAWKLTAFTLVMAGLALGILWPQLARRIRS